MPTHQPPARSDVRDEFAAMRRIAAAFDSLDALDAAARNRVETWAAARYLPAFSARLVDDRTSVSGPDLTWTEPAQ